MCAVDDHDVNDFSPGYSVCTFVLGLLLPTPRNIAVVTSAFHMPRSRAIVQTCASLIAQDIWQDSNWYAAVVSIVSQLI